jgi:hypothetical protein
VFLLDWGEWLNGVSTGKLLARNGSSKERPFLEKEKADKTITSLFK